MTDVVRRLRDFASRMKVADASERTPIHLWQMERDAALNLIDLAEAAAAEIERLRETLPDVNDLDEVVHTLGIEDSHVTPAEAVKNLQTELTTWQNIAKQAGACMSCAVGAPEPFGCIDCLNTGWAGGAPLRARAEAAEQARAAAERECARMEACADRWIIALEDAAHLHGIPLPDEIAIGMRAARARFRRKPQEDNAKVWARSPHRHKAQQKMEDRTP